MTDRMHIDDDVGAGSNDESWMSGTKRTYPSSKASGTDSAGAGSPPSDEVAGPSSLSYRRAPSTSDTNLSSIVSLGAQPSAARDRPSKRQRTAANPKTQIVPDPTTTSASSSSHADLAAPTAELLRRTGLRRKWGQLSRFESLPPELLRLIFDHYADLCRPRPAMTDSASPMTGLNAIGSNDEISLIRCRNTLTSISSTIRAQALCHPRLWSEIVLGLDLARLKKHMKQQEQVEDPVVHGHEGSPHARSVPGYWSNISQQPPHPTVLVRHSSASHIPQRPRQRIVTRLPAQYQWAPNFLRRATHDAGPSGTFIIRIYDASMSEPGVAESEALELEPGEKEELVARYYRGLLHNLGTAVARAKVIDLSRVLDVIPTVLTCLLGAEVNNSRTFRLPSISIGDGMGFGTSSIYSAIDTASTELQTAPPLANLTTLLLEECDCMSLLPDQGYDILILRPFYTHDVPYWWPGYPQSSDLPAQRVHPAPNLRTLRIYDRRAFGFIRDHELGQQLRFIELTGHTMPECPSTLHILDLCPQLEGMRLQIEFDYDPDDPPDDLENKAVTAPRLRFLDLGYRGATLQWLTAPRLEVLYVSRLNRTGDQLPEILTDFMRQSQPPLTALRASAVDVVGTRFVPPGPAHGPDHFPPLSQEPLPTSAIPTGADNLDAQTAHFRQLATAFSSIHTLTVRFFSEVELRLVLDSIVASCAAGHLPLLRTLIFKGGIPAIGADGRQRFEMYPEYIVERIDRWARMNPDTTKDKVVSWHETWSCDTDDTTTGVMKSERLKALERDLKALDLGKDALRRDHYDDASLALLRALRGF